MANYALLDENNLVTTVISGKDETDTSHDWELFYGEFHGCIAKRTSYNTSLNQHRLGGEPFRGNYAGIGYTFNQSIDAFIPPKPYQSWLLDEAVCSWNAPVPYPNDGKDYKWDEPTISWVEIPQETTGE